MNATIEIMPLILSGWAAAFNEKREVALKVERNDAIAKFRANLQVTDRDGEEYDRYEPKEFDTETEAVEDVLALMSADIKAFLRVQDEDILISNVGSRGEMIPV